jgi:hypothetical protein
VEAAALVGHGSIIEDLLGARDDAVVDVAVDAAAQGTNVDIALVDVAAGADGELLEDVEGLVEERAQLQGLSGAVLASAGLPLGGG